MCRWRPVPSPDRRRGRLPTADKMDCAQAGQNHHIHQHRQGGNGDGGRLHIALDCSKATIRTTQRGRSAPPRRSRTPPTNTSAPYRSHAHCQMRSIRETRRLSALDPWQTDLNSSRQGVLIATDFETLVCRLFRDSVQFCSGLVDLVVGVCRHGSRGHARPVAGQ